MIGPVKRSQTFLEAVVIGARHGPAEKAVIVSVRDIMRGLCKRG